ncbi:MAG: DUF697 domain-containing protein [Saprospiraceae bacterium]|nr:DUF697 domain-containing protein [Saprospiraceae bacterium]
MSDSNSTKSKHADTIIRNHVIWSMGAGMIPILIADIFAVSALQMDMIKQLCKAYDLDYQETQGKAIVTSLTSSTLARLGARSLVKLIPGLGILGGIPVAIFAGASTYALGEVFKRHFETGGTILDFDIDRVKKYYQEKFEKGKSVVKDWEKQARKGEGVFSEPTEAEAKSDDIVEEAIVEVTEDEEVDVIAKLRELGELKEKGVLSKEEFKAMKAKLIEDF